jgi:formylglycine-generating enzyme required for sulfatase activity
MGSDHHYPEEAPARRVRLEGFWIDRFAVTNAQFRRFVESTGYVTVAERPPDPRLYPGVPRHLLVAGSTVFKTPGERLNRLDSSLWWAYVPGACWRHPEGPESSIEGRDDHPVVHVAYEDALAYAAWIGKSLPTEAQWERAARGGLEGRTYAWGDELRPEGRTMANVWDGEFPWENAKAPAHQGTLPVGRFPPNGYGLFDMIGNVWEWTADWYAESESASRTSPRKAAPQRGGRDRVARKVIKGGSYLCAANHCARYRPAARAPEALDTSTCHLGFRCVAFDP